MVSNVDTQHTLMSKMKGFDLMVYVGWPATGAQVWERDSADAHSYSVLIQQNTRAHPEAHCWVVGMTTTSINKTLGNVLYN